MLSQYIFVFGNNIYGKVSILLFLPKLILLYKTLRILNAVSQLLKVIIELLSLII